MNPIDSGSASTTNPNGLGDPQARGGHSIAQGGAGNPDTTGEPLDNEPHLGDRCWAEARSADELADLLARTAHPIVVAFEDRDCDHCRAQRAMLSLAWDQLSWHVTTVRVDGRRLPEVADDYRILGYPTLLVFSAGQVVDRLPGRRDARTVIDRLSRLTRPSHGAGAGSAPSAPSAGTPAAVSPVAS